MKCTQTVGRVVDARSVAKERVNTGGSVLVAIDVGLERIFANGRVEITIIDKERPITNGSVLEASARFCSKNFADRRNDRESESLSLARVELFGGKVSPLLSFKS